jgi:high-affinity Fe2+/Pb2+ permease
MSTKVKIEGMEELKKYFENVPAYMENEILTTMKKICADLQKESMSQAPKKTGALRGSAHSEASASNGLINGYVGFFVPYATVQHEGLDFVHKQGNAKYLENPYKENRDKYIKFVADATKKAVEKK